MEDEFFIANGGRFAAVFDGHGGGGVSATLRERLFGLVCHHLKRKKWEEQDDISKKRASISCHVAALRSAFEDIDDQVLEDDSLQYQGSTAVAVVVHEGEDGVRTLLSANVGDSRAILSRRGRAVDLTRDHKPNDEREKARIMSMGETIEWDQYCKVHRVRNLSLSRAIGDRFAKPVVSGQVEIKHYSVLEGDEFVLLASDGLWDVMSSQDAVSYVNERLDQPPPGGLMGPEDAERLKFTRRKNMSRYVATEAIKRGTADNVCVLIVWLNDNTDKTV
jgi:serine/threonine protein phosphatase PrpC